MSKNRFISLLSFMVLVVFVLSLFSAVNVLADDETPPVATEETDQPTEEVVPAETEPAPTSETEVASEPEDIVEILETAPDGVDVVVLDENGDAVSLATEEALEIILNGDPMWCPDGVTPGADTLNQCTPSFTDFWELIDELAIIGGYSGNGTIYVAYNYSDSESNIYIDHTDGFMSSLGDLVIQGGWDFGVDGIYDNPAYQSNLGNNSLFIENWVGNVTINNIFISGADGPGIYVDTDGNINLDYVTVEDADLEGAYLEAGGNVTVENSSFEDNGQTGYSAADYYHPADGLYVEAVGNVTLTNVYAGYNAGNGTTVYSGGTTNVTDSIFAGNGWGNGLGNEDYTDITGAGTLIYSSTYSGGNGLYVESADDITLDYVFVNGSAGDGAFLDSNGSIMVIDSDFNLNGGLGYTQATVEYEDYIGSTYTAFTLEHYLGSGLIAYASETITLTEVVANGNANDGANVSADGNVLVTTSVFSQNGWGNNNETSTYDFFEDQCSDDYCGYDMLYDFLVSNGGDAFCELVTGYDAVIFDPCSDYGYIDVHAPNFIYSVTRIEDSLGSFGNEYTIEQYGGAGLVAQSYAGSINLEEVGFYSNGFDGAALNSLLGTTVTDAEIIDNGYLGYLYLNEYGYSSLLGDGIGGSLEFYYGDGLLANSGGDITLTNVIAAINAFHGVDVDSAGLLSVQNSGFYENGAPVLIGGEDGLFGEFLYDMVGLDFTLGLPVSGFYFGADLTPESIEIYGDFGSGSGLFGDGGTGITLTDVEASGNLGYGVDLFSPSVVDLSQVLLYDNGYGFFGSLYMNEDALNYYSEYFAYNGSGALVVADGNITLTDVTANGNVLNGVELYSSSSDSVFVENGVFSGNGYYGVDLFGYVYDDGVYFEELDAVKYGSGIVINSNGTVTLLETVADGNYQDGASIHTNGGNVYVVCGEYNGNGDYGVNESGAPVLGLFGADTLGNGIAPYNYSQRVVVSSECVIFIPEPKFVAPVPVGRLCGRGEFATFLMQNGDFSVFPCPINDIAYVRTVEDDELPAPLPDEKPNEPGGEYLYQSALRTDLMRDNEFITVNTDFMVVSFLIPEGADLETLAIMYWNGEAWLDLMGEVSDHGPNGVVEEGKLYLQVSTQLLGYFALVAK